MMGGKREAEDHNGINGNICKHIYTKKGEKASQNWKHSH